MALENDLMWVHSKFVETNAICICTRAQFDDRYEIENYNYPYLEGNDESFKFEESDENLKISGNEADEAEDENLIGSPCDEASCSSSSSSSCSSNDSVVNNWVNFREKPLNNLSSDEEDDYKLHAENFTGEFADDYKLMKAMGLPLSFTKPRKASSPQKRSCRKNNVSQTVEVKKEKDSTSKEHKEQEVKSTEPTKQAQEISAAEQEAKLKAFEDMETGKKKRKSRKKRHRSSQKNCEEDQLAKNIETDWQSYWKQHGESIILNTWIAKYKDYIDPEFLNSRKTSAASSDSGTFGKDGAESMNWESMQDRFETMAFRDKVPSEETVAAGDSFKASTKTESVTNTGMDCSIDESKADVDAESDGTLSEGNGIAQAKKIKFNGVKLESEVGGTSDETNLKHEWQSEYPDIEFPFPVKKKYDNMFSVRTSETDNANDKADVTDLQEPVSWEYLWQVHAEEQYNIKYDEFKAGYCNSLYTDDKDFESNEHYYDYTEPWDYETFTQFDDTDNFDFVSGESTYYSDDGPPDEIPIRIRRDCADDQDENLLYNLGFVIEPYNFTSVEWKKRRCISTRSWWCHSRNDPFRIWFNDPTRTAYYREQYNKMPESILEEPIMDETAVVEIDGKIVAEEIIIAEPDDAELTSKEKRLKLAPEVTDDLKKYWRQRYRLFSLFDKGIKLDRESWYSVTPEKFAKHIAERCRCNVVIDAFCGAGGNAIQFAFTCDLVIAIDIDPKKIELARHNAKIYGVANKIEFVCADFLTLAPKLKADVIFLSPPWGGPEYLQADEFSLSQIQPDICKVFELCRKITDNIALYVPKTTIVNELVKLAGPDGKVEVQQHILNQNVKAVMAYYGVLVMTEMSDDSD